MDNELNELMKRAIKYYIGSKLGEDCTCLPDHDACEFCKNKNAYNRLKAIKNGDYPK